MDTVECGGVVIKNRPLPADCQPNDGGGRVHEGEAPSTSSNIPPQPAARGYGGKKHQTRPDPQSQSQATGETPGGYMHDLPGNGGRQLSAQYSTPMGDGMPPSDTRGEHIAELVELFEEHS